MPFNSELNVIMTSVSPPESVADIQPHFGKLIDTPTTMEGLMARRKPRKHTVVVDVDSDDDYDDDDDLEGGSKVGKWFKKQGKKVSNTVKKVEKGVKNVAFKADRDTRGLQKEFERSATKDNGLIKTIISRTLDEVPGMVGDAMAAAAIATGNPQLAPGVKYGVTKTAKFGRKVLKDKTGYGSKNIHDIMISSLKDYQKVLNMAPILSLNQDPPVNAMN